MKKIFILFIMMILFTNFAHAEENFESKKIQLICAMCSFASYDENEGILTRDFLISRGWKIDAITVQNSKANVKAYLFEKNFDRKNIKILVITGTEDLKDVEVDFRIGRVPLHENTDEEIFVHRGFRDYTDLALSDGVKEFLLEELQKNPEGKFYITGHSLGGAVALMIAIRLIDSGANPNQIKVVTFGAPAIGNSELANFYENKFDFTRIGISGDIIKKSLQVLGYVHFGNYVDYKQLLNHNSHEMSAYLDGAIKNFYEVGGFENNLEFDAKNKISTPIYIAPIKLTQKNFKENDEKIIVTLLNYGLKSRYNKIIFDEKKYSVVNNVKKFSYDVTEYLQPAKNFGCEYILLQFLHCESVKDSKNNEKRVTLDEMIFDLNGNLISMQAAGPTTKNLTMIEAAVFAQESLRKAREKILLP